MATVINNPSGPSDRVLERDDSGAGWAIALIILVALIVGLFLWYRYTVPGVPSTGTENINVTVPSSDTNGGTSGGTSGGTNSGSNGGTSGSGSVQGSQSSSGSATY